MTKQQRKNKLRHIRYLKKRYLGKDFDVDGVNPFMLEAIAEGYKGIKKHHGGPFGTVIVKDGKIIARGHNQVLKNKDASCHGEMQAMRKACKKLQTFDLSGCELYSSAECCKMCLCSTLWHNIDKVYYACTLKDNGMIGFRDDKFEKITGKRNLPKGYAVCIDREAGLRLFKYYKKHKHSLY